MLNENPHKVLYMLIKKEIHYEIKERSLKRRIPYRKWVLEAIEEKLKNEPQLKENDNGK